MQLQFEHVSRFHNRNLRAPVTRFSRLRGKVAELLHIFTFGVSIMAGNNVIQSQIEEESHEVTAETS
jgi:hypothetical protein